MKFKKLIFESFDIVPITEKRLNKSDIIKIISSKLREQKNSDYDIEYTINVLDSYKFLFGYRKTINNNDYLFMYNKKMNFFELHFFYLDDLESNGEDIQAQDNSINVFSYMMSICLILLKDNRPVRIISPSKKRTLFYTKISNKIIKKYNLDYIAVIKDDCIEFLKSKGKTDIVESFLRK
jgi:hypothetical protein